MTDAIRFDSADVAAESQPSARYITLVYSVLASIWIFGSDMALLLFAPELTQLAWMGTAKGIAFVVVTSALLYSILLRAQAAQHRSAMARRAVEVRYRLLAENAPDIIYRYELLPYPHFSYISPAATAITGYPPDDYYDDPALGRAFVQIQPETPTGVIRSHLFRWARSDGRVIWLEQRNVLIYNHNHTVVAIEGVTRDVTEQQQNAAQLNLLETALSATASAVVIADHDGNIQWVNNAFTTLTGYQREEAIGGNPRLLRSGRHTNEFYTELWDTVLSGQVWHGELINKHKDGHCYHEEQTITPVRNQHGAITHFIAIKQDVTARVAREREQRVLATLAASLRNVESRTQLPLAILEQLIELLGLEGAALALRSAIQGELLLEAGVGTWADLTGMPLLEQECLVDQAACELDQCHNINGQISLKMPVHKLSNFKKLGICTPLNVSGEVIGALWTLHDTTPEPADLHLLKAVAEMASSAIHRADLHEQTIRRLQRLTCLHAIDQSIAASLDIDLTLNTVLDQALAEFGVDAAAVLLIDRPNQALRYRTGRGFHTEIVARTSVTLGEGLLGEAVVSRRSIRLPIIPVIDEAYTRGNLLSAEEFRAYYAMPLVANGQIKGVIELFNRMPLKPDSEWLSFLETLAAHVAIAIDNAELVERLQRANDELALAYDSTLSGWARALELRDSETEGHSRRVTSLTIQLARAIGIDEEALTHIRRGALLHDIGKMGVPDAILHKPGPLNPEEWTVMREHPIHAYRLLSPVAYLRPALDIPYAHHERWGGGGYPRGLSGEEIPLAARIFAVVDVWDALRTKRPYKEAWSKEAARNYICEQAGKHFDPMVVTAFMQLLDQADEQHTEL